jgi:hypothetical protein
MKNTDYTEFLKLSPDELRKLQKKRGWALSVIGYIVYGVLRLCGCKPKSYYGICQYFEVGKGNSGVNLGWFFICGKNLSERWRNHEVGHGIQNAVIGGLPMLFCSIGSFFRFWKRQIFGAKTSYDSWWFEGQATELGNEYVKRIKGE